MTHCLCMYIKCYISLFVLSSVVKQLVNMRGGHVEWWEVNIEDFV